MKSRLAIPAGAVLAIAVTLATVCAAVAGSWLDTFPAELLSPEPDRISLGIVGGIALLAGILSLRSLVLNRRRAPMLMAAALVTGTSAVYAYGAELLRPPGPADPFDESTFSLFFPVHPSGVVLALGLLTFILPTLALLLGLGRTRAWFVGHEQEGLRLRSAARFAFRRPSTWLPVLLPAAVAWYVFPMFQGFWRYVENFAVQMGPEAGQVSQGFSLILDGNTEVRSMLAAMLCLAVSLALRYRVTLHGVVVSLGSFALLNARWERVRWVDRMEGGGLCVHYRGRFGWPCSITLRPGGLENGAQLVAAANQAVAERTLRHRTWSGVRRATILGWSAIGLSMALMVVQSLWHSALMVAVEGTSPTQFAQLAVPVEGAAFYDLTLLLFGIGVGMLGSRTAGRGSLPLVVGLMVGATVLPTPLLHWLVWIACYAILTAVQTPVDHGTFAYTTPTDLQWSVAFALGALGPAFAALGYLVGTTAGSRPHRLLRSPVGGPEPVADMGNQAEPTAGALILPGSKTVAAG